MSINPWNITAILIIKKKKKTSRICWPISSRRYYNFCPLPICKSVWQIPQKSISNLTWRSVTFGRGIHNGLWSSPHFSIPQAISEYSESRGLGKSIEAILMKVISKEGGLSIHVYCQLCMCSTELCSQKFCVYFDHALITIFESKFTRICLTQSLYLW